MEINDDSIVIQKKPRGRPKKSISVAELTEPLVIIPKKNGRPKKYITEEELKQAKKENSKKTYDERGHIYSRIISLKKNYDLSYPNKEDIKNRTLEELTSILKQMINDIEEIKKAKHIQYINNLQNKLFEAVNKKNFKPLRKDITFI
jgi:hypothetical protein